MITAASSVLRVAPIKAGCPVLLLLVRPQECLSSCTMSADSVAVAWPIVHSRSQVQHPHQSCLPGRKVAVGTIFRRITAFIVDLRLFPLVSVQIDRFVGYYSPCDMFSASCAPCSLGIVCPTA